MLDVLFKTKDELVRNLTSNISNPEESTRQIMGGVSRCPTIFFLAAVSMLRGCSKYCLVVGIHPVKTVPILMNFQVIVTAVENLEDKKGMRQVTALARELVGAVGMKLRANQSIQMEDGSFGKHIVLNGHHSAQFNSPISRIRSP